MFRRNQLQGHKTRGQCFSQGYTHLHVHAVHVALLTMQFYDQQQLAKIYMYKNMRTYDPPLERLFLSPSPSSPGYPQLLLCLAITLLKITTKTYVTFDR